MNLMTTWSHLVIIQPWKDSFNINWVDTLDRVTWLLKSGSPPYLNVAFSFLFHKMGKMYGSPRSHSTVVSINWVNVWNTYNSKHLINFGIWSVRIWEFLKPAQIYIVMLLSCKQLESLAWHSCCCWKHEHRKNKIEEWKLMVSQGSPWFPS